MHWGLPLLVGFAAASGSCASASLESGPPGSCTHGYGPASTQAVGFDEDLEQRQECHFGPGTKTTDTVGSGAPSLRPIEHVIVLMLENRSFDHLLSDLPAVGMTDADVAARQSNPDGKAGAVARYHETVLCAGSSTQPGHEWSDAHLA